MRSVRIHSRPFLDSVVALLISCFVIYVRTGWLGLNEGLDNWVNSTEDEEEQRRQQAEEAFLFQCFTRVYIFGPKKKSPYRLQSESITHSDANYSVNTLN